MQLYEPEDLATLIMVRYFIISSASYVKWPFLHFVSVIPSLMLSSLSVYTYFYLSELSVEVQTVFPTLFNILWLGFFTRKLNTISVQNCLLVCTAV
jgi:hypothetical protein